MEEQLQEPSPDHPVATSADHETIQTCSLVLAATHISHRIIGTRDGEFGIIVPNGDRQQARDQLEAYFRENRNWPPPQIIAAPGGFPALIPTLVLAGALAWFHAITGSWSVQTIWFTAGANDTAQVLEHGQWYRLVTALTLHADISHLIGNCLIGSLLVFFFLQINGPGLGLLAILAFGTAGNLLNTLIHGSGHLSVGFSTAVFGLVGALSIYQIVEQRQPFGIRMFVPFLAGAALLAMLGSAGERTDLGAHFFGLLSGMVLGSLLSLKPLKQLRSTAFFQVSCLLAVLFLLLICWNQALTDASLTDNLQVQLHGWSTP